MPGRGFLYLLDGGYISVVFRSAFRGVLRVCAVGWVFTVFRWGEMKHFPKSVRYTLVCNNPSLVHNNQPLKVDYTVEILSH